MGVENSAEDNESDLRQLTLLPQQQQQQHFSFLASSVGGYTKHFWKFFHAVPYL